MDHNEQVITNLTTFDPFADTVDNTGGQPTQQIHLRIQQRNGRKCITTVQGLSESLDLKPILKTFKKSFSCNGSISKNDEYGKIIQMSGDQRDNVKKWLLKQSIVSEKEVIVHGF
jgi:translation initiation factor 1